MTQLGEFQVRQGKLYFIKTKDQQNRETCKVLAMVVGVVAGLSCLIHPILGIFIGIPGLFLWGASKV